MCSGFVGATWMGPTFYWGIQEPLRGILKLKVHFSVIKLNNNGLKVFS